MFDIPDRLLLKASQSEERGAWLKALPGLCSRLCSDWDLEPGATFSECHVSFVVAVRRGPTEAVLKVPMPAAVEFGTIAADARVGEADALLLWAGNGAVRLLDQDETSGAILMERCVPGTALDLADPHDQDEIAANLLSLLHVPRPENGRFVLLADRVRRVSDNLAARYEQCGSPFDRRLLDDALAYLSELMITTGDQTLLHGDFHHHNILTADRRPWLAIDPLPMVGDPAYDAVQYLLFRKGDLTEPEAEWGSVIKRFCARLGVDAERTRAWLFARLVSDAVARCSEEGDAPAALEQRQGDLWSARLVRRLGDRRSGSP